MSEYPRISIATLRRQERAARGVLTRALNEYLDHDWRVSEARVERAEQRAHIARARLDAATSQEAEAA